MLISTVPAGVTSRPHFASAGSIVKVSPPAGASAVVEYTSGSLAAISNGAATWAPWSKGTASIETSDYVGNPVYVRVTAVGGAVPLDVETSPSAALLAQFRPDWGLPSGSGGGSAAAGVLADVTASFNIGTAHAGQTVPVNSASAVVATIQTDAALTLPVGTAVTLVRKGTGGVSFAGPGVTLRTSRSLAAYAQNSTIVATKLAANDWLIAGELL